MSNLSPNERNVLQLAAGGYTNREIGKMLFLGEETIKSQMKSCLYKLGARNRAQAVAIGMRARIIS